MIQPTRQCGFTIIELVVTMVISVILAGVVTQVITRPMESYASASHRAKLVDSANAVLARFSREVRGALPNSIRVGCSGTCIEFLNTVDGGRYRAVAPGNTLDFNPANADSQFDILGSMLNPSAITTGAGANDCVNGAASCLVVYNTGQSGSNAYQGDNIATISSFVSPFNSIRESLI